MKYVKYFQGVLAGLSLASILSCASSNLLKNNETDNFYRDYKIVKNARGGDLLSKSQFDSLLRTLDKNKIDELRLKLSYEAINEILGIRKDTP